MVFLWVTAQSLLWVTGRGQLWGMERGLMSLSHAGGRYHQHGRVSKAQTTSSVDVRCPVQALSKVRRRCSMKTAVCQNARSRNVTRSGTLNQWSSRSNAGVMHSDRLAEKTKRAAAFKTDCSRSCSWPGIPARTELQ